MITTIKSKLGGFHMNLFLKPMNSEMQNIPLGEYTTFGSALDCSFQLKNERLSERHARIEKKDQGYVLRDLRSSEGTFLNEARIIEAQIQEGDLLQMGPFEFKVCTDDLLQKSKLTSKNENWNLHLQSLNRIAKTHFPVLLLGPSGTGKDILAQEIHRCSPRSQAEFVSVNCSALTETLVESELFGHLKGSFTGAISDRKGAFETARGGTLFLDEIGDLPYALQAKLLRALENNEIRPVGSDRTIKTDVRILAATHQNLSEKIQLGHFRSDLFFRLNVIQIMPPAMKDRMEDFEEILMSFAKSFRVRFSVPAITRLKRCEWPGNIREIKNLVARAKAIFPDDYIQIEQVEHLLGQNQIPGLGPLSAQAMTHSQLPVIKELEKQMIIKRLAANKGNQRLTAHDLGMPKSTLHDRLRLFEIDVRTYKI